MKINLPFNCQIRLYASIEAKRVGVCSRVYGEPKRHALLWDFDNILLEEVLLTLEDTMLKYKLPSIYIIQSSEGKYHAYCFTRRLFKEVIHILSDTPCLDFNYLRLGVIRGYFTLRISEKGKTPFKIVKVLISKFPDEISATDLTVNEYLTSNRG